jgi:hypothetical protein
MGARHGVAELRSFALQLRNSVPGTDADALGKENTSRYPG